MTSEQQIAGALSRSTPEAQGISSDAVRGFIEAVERAGLGLHSVMLLRHGQVVAEGWWEPYGPALPHMLYSLSKSFTSTAAGIAIAEGLLTLDDLVLSFFPEHVPAQVGPNLAALRLRHLLSMSTGHAQDTSGYMRQGKSEAQGKSEDKDEGDWVRRFLSLPIEYAPGTHFVYNNGATYLVSAIVQKVTGQTVLDFLRPRLFEPLGILNPTWESSPQGISAGAWGLSIRTEDIAKFGLLYLQKGLWSGRRLLPESWAAEATSVQVANGTDPNSDWAQGYGFQFWRCLHGAYRGDGAFGQFAVVLPEQDAVVAITSGSPDMGAILTEVWKHLLPNLGPSALPADTSAQTRLHQKLAGLALPVPGGESASTLAAEVSGKTYTFAAEAGAGQEAGLEALTWNFSPETAVVTLRDARGDHRIEASADHWQRGTTVFFGPGTEQIAARGVWTAADTYVLTVCCEETPYIFTLTSRFLPGKIQFYQRRNVSFGPTEAALREGLLS